MGTNWISSLSKYICEKTYCLIEEFVFEVNKVSSVKFQYLELLGGWIFLFSLLH